MSLKLFITSLFEFRFDSELELLKRKLFEKVFELGREDIVSLSKRSDSLGLFYLNFISIKHKKNIIMKRKCERKFTFLDLNYLH